MSEGAVTAADRGRYGRGGYGKIPAHTAMQTTDGQADDIALLVRVAARDQNALADLYDRHCRLLFGLALRILRNRAEAEEVLQEVFVQAWTKVDTYSAALGTPVAWLVRIARNRAIDRLRANQVRDRTVEAFEPALPAVETAETHVVRGEEQRAVLRALAALPPEQRELIEHAYFEGLTQSELAERFHLPLGTVKTRVRTGMMSLRRGLGAAVVPFQAQGGVS
jgi:RNA polymerase sigma-70 factor, ECF subfamily